jgi:hypothetical protein
MIKIHHVPEIPNCSLNRARYQKMTILTLLKIILFVRTALLKKPWQILEVLLSLRPGIGDKY